MRFSGLPMLALALASVIDAAPAVSEGGLAPWVRVPRAPRNARAVTPYHKQTKRDSTITIDEQSTETEVTDEVVEEDIDGVEIAFEKKVTQLVVKNTAVTIDQNDQRIAVMEQTVNTVIQVVQVIVDVASNSNRYAVSAILADNGSDKTMTCQITAAQTWTVGNGTCANQAAATDGTMAVVADGTATATAVMAMQTGGLTAPFNMANQTVLLPANSTAPEPAEGVMVMDDPAANITAPELSMLTC